LPKRKPRDKDTWKKAKITRDQKANIAISVSRIDDKKLRKTLEGFLKKQAKWQNYQEGKKAPGKVDKKK
jgi:hypothetical protein